MSDTAIAKAKYLQIETASNGNLEATLNDVVSFTHNGPQRSEAENESRYQFLQVFAASKMLVHFDLRQLLATILR